MCAKYAIGLDFGTLSGRGVLVRCQDGKIMSKAVKEYTHGVMDRFLPDGKTKLPEGSCLEYPGDYLEVLDFVIPSLIRNSRVKKEDIIGIGIDFTACSVLPIDQNAVPLCMKKEFSSRRNAYVKIWKHHSARDQGDRVNKILKELGINEEPRFGGTVSPELMVPKVMEIFEEDREIYDRADEIIEAGDWLTRLLTNSHSRSISMAGNKSWWEVPEGYPSEEIYDKLCPGLGRFAVEKMPGAICEIGQTIGKLCPEWASRLGLNPGVVVAPAIIDSHAGFPGSGIYRGDQVMLVLGTSSVVLALSKKPFSRKGVYGNVKNTVVPGYYSLESGLAAVGDLFGWFTDNMVPGSCAEQAKREKISIHELLSQRAGMLAPGESGLIALDWWNGNKTPFVNVNLFGVLMGMTLKTKPEEIYRTLIEATAFGARRILDIYEENDVDIKEIIASGGITHKNHFLMQIYADILGKNIRIAESDETAALGSAIYAALSAGTSQGGYDHYEEAVKHMCKNSQKTYIPNPEYTKQYDNLYNIYCQLENMLGGQGENLFHELLKERTRENR